MTTQAQTPPAHVGMLKLLGGIQVTCAVSCLAQLGIPDMVEGGPKSTDELARQTGAAPEPALRGWLEGVLRTAGNSARP